MSEFPIGSVVDDRYTITEALAGGPDRGLYRATSGEQRRLVAIGLRQKSDLSETRSALRMPIGRVTMLRHAGPLGTEGRHDALCEDEPAGVPASIALRGKVSPDAALRLARELSIVADIASASGFALVGLRPELVYVDPHTLALTQVAPRSERFLFGITQPSYGVPYQFARLYLAPEILRTPALPFTASCDYFSICAMLWEWMTGAHPFGDGGFVEQVERITTGRRTTWSGPPELEEVIADGLEPDSTYRDDLSALTERLSEFVA